ncbi:hypothetical protein I546_3447 [Mycobacterium kansasii 732]|nr:hypothetical protein I546_3447 [Mycobacterium kansasii 732]
MHSPAAERDMVGPGPERPRVISNSAARSNTSSSRLADR